MIIINTNSCYYDSILFLNKNGQYHRIDGPAIIQGNLKEWYIEGYEYNELEYYNKLKEMGLG